MYAPRNKSRRSAAILIKFLILLPVLFAWVGLVIDTGLLLATRRQAQNAADAAALAAAMDLSRSRQQGTEPGEGVLEATAILYAEQNGMGDPAQVEVHYPPTTTTITAFRNTNYVEVVITRPLKTWFIQVVGANPNQQVTARAVAGLESVQQKDLLVVLDPTAVPGLTVGGTGTLRVEGAVRVNSEGGGVDADGNPVNSNHGVAISAGPSNIYAGSISSVGGVDKPTRLLNIADNSVLGPDGFKGGELPWPDPYASLPTPTTATGVDSTEFGDVNVTMPAAGQETKLSPGVYSSIKITGGGAGTVTFLPGIYVLRPTKNVQTTLQINNSGGTVVGNNVMFYNAGSNYVPASGDTGPGAPHYGGITFNSQSLKLTPLNNPTSPFNGMVLYQARLNTEAFDLQAMGSNVDIQGTIYDKAGQVKLAGGATSFNSPFIVGSLVVTGSATLKVGVGQTSTGYLVYLVE